MESRAIYFHTANGPYGSVLSNFANIPLIYKGQQYANSESAFQCEKTLNPVERKAFIDVEPDKAKKLGRHCTLRPDWEEVKLQVMIDVVRAKFGIEQQMLPCSLDAGEFLANTGDRLLLEDTTGWKDNCWGCDFNTEPLGKNWLGMCLMRIRSEITGNAIVKTPYGTMFDVVENFNAFTTDEQQIRKLNDLYTRIYNDKLYVH